MNSNNIVFSTIAIMVCVVLIGCCLVPIVQDSVVGRDVTHEVTYTNEISGSKSVYKLVSGDSITVDLSGYTVNAGGVDYTTTSDIMLVDPDDGLVIPDYTNIAVKLYEADGITEIESDFSPVTQVVCSDNTTWIVTDNGKIYGCGRNYYGHQGSGDTTDVTTFTDRTPSGKTVKQVACKTNVTWIVTDDGLVYGCGGNSYGQQGSGDTTNVTTFTDRTPSGKTVKQVVCTTDTTWIVTDDGLVYGCGANSSGQQGSGDTTNVTTFTDRTPSGKTVKQVACEYNATWIVTDDGLVYGCGGNIDGQQGSGDTTTVKTFTDRTPSGKTVKQVACTTDTTWIVTDDGLVYGCGDNSSGQQGSGNTTTVKTFTDRTPSGKTVKQVACTMNGTWIVTDDGLVYGCGANGNGQQGSGDTTNVTTFTDRTPSGKTVINVIPSFSSNIGTTWILTSDGLVYGCGANGNGQQGSGDTTTVKTFTDRTPSGKTVVQMACSTLTTWIVTDDGLVYGCGANSSGQQGSGDTTNVTTFTDRSPSTPSPISITYTDTDLTIKDIVIESQLTIYLISSIAALDTAGLIYIDSTDTPLEYYASPASVLSFSAAADSFYIGQGTEILTGYDTTAALTINQGTATQVSTIYTYSGATFPITATNVSGYSILIDGSYTGTYTTHEGGTDNQMWAILATLTVTLTIIGVVLGAVRMIGGRE